MKTASRYMPKYKSRPISPLGWLCLVVLVGLFFWLIWRFPYLLFLIPAFILIWMGENKKRNKHFKDLLKDRDDDSICTFSRHFEFSEVDTWVLRAVYEQLQSYLNGEKENFPIRATDDVFKDLMIDEEDFEYGLIEEIAQRTGRTLVNADSNPYYAKANIIENLVFFFNEQPKINASK